MKPPATPSNEEARLLALAEFDILDTAAEPAFDALTKLAARALGVPIALVSIVDAQRQWFKSRYGLEAPQTSREVSFCGHVVAAEAALVVADAWADERFADNPLVTGEPRVRFYAGEPLRTPEGFVLGTLCAIDHQPRQFSAEEREVLAMFAGQVVALLELRRKERLLASERVALAEQRRFFELSLELLCTADASTLHFRALNPAFEATLGWSLEELRSQPLTEFIHPDDLEKTLAAAKQLVTDPTPLTAFENRYRHKDGHWLTLAWTATQRDGTLFAAARDMSGYRETERQLRSRESDLRESEARWRALFEAMVEGVVLQAPSGAIVSSNLAAHRILGLTHDQLMGVSSVDPLWRCVHEDGSPFPGETHPAMVTLATGHPQTNVIMGVHKPSGELTWISINSRALTTGPGAKPYAAITTFRDITDQKHAEKLAAQFARQERLVTTGTLAAGVGHEINNPLSYVMANIDFSLDELREMAGGSPSARLKDLIGVLGEAREGAERVRKIVRGLRSLAREDSAPSATDVNAVIEMSINMSMHELRQSATLERRLAEVPPALADESRLTQVVVNLLVNAAQAFASHDPSQNRIGIQTELQADGRIAISIADNGPGIAPNILPRIFDPFFTTKEVGRGTGLGLSISNSIVSALGGELTCDTRWGVGTTFRVILPAAVPQELLPEGRTAESVSPRGKVLIVDDEEAALRAMARLLERDHAVTALSDPRQALGLLEGGAEFDVVFCDLMMPHLTGAELFNRVSGFAPSMASRFVFISGGVIRDDIERFLANVPNERLEKPFSSQNLRGIAGRFVSLFKSTSVR
jgi:PAS domain S-box-containing protein